MPAPQSNYWAQMQTQAAAVDDPSMGNPAQQELYDGEAQAPDGAVPVPTSPEEAQAMGIDMHHYEAIHRAIAKGQLAPVPPQQRLQDLSQQYGDKQKQLIQQQETGVNQIQQLINDYKNNGTYYDPRPLAAFADILSPENHNLEKASQMGVVGESPQQKQQKIIALQEALQGKREGLTKSQAEALKEQINAIKAQKDTGLDDALKRAKIGYFNNADRTVLQDNQQAFAAHQKNLGNLATNKALQQKLQQVQGIDNAGKIIEEAPVVTPQIFHDYQQALVAAIQRGNSGAAERAQRYMESAGIKKAEILQYLSGKPMDVGKDSPLVKAAQGFAKTERTNINKQYNQLADAVTGGNTSMYSTHPKLKQDLMTAIKNYKGMAAPEGAPPPPQPGDVVQGHVFKGGDPADPNSWEQQ